MPVGKLNVEGAWNNFFEPRYKRQSWSLLWKDKKLFQYQQSIKFFRPHKTIYDVKNESFCSLIRVQLLSEMFRVSLEIHWAIQNWPGQVTLLEASTSDKFSHLCFLKCTCFPKNNILGAGRSQLLILSSKINSCARPALRVLLVLWKFTLLEAPKLIYVACTYVKVMVDFRWKMNPK